MSLPDHAAHFGKLRDLVFESLLNLQERLGSLPLSPQDQGWLRVGSSGEAPAVLKQDTERRRRQP